MYSYSVGLNRQLKPALNDLDTTECDVIRAAQKSGFSKTFPPLDQQNFRKKTLRKLQKTLSETAQNILHFLNVWYQKIVHGHLQ